jgi:hypothetical protein
VAEAFAWGLIAASSLLLGGLLVLGLPLRRHALGLVMAFGAGVLIPLGELSGFRRAKRGRGHPPDLTHSMGILLVNFTRADLGGTWAAGPSIVQARR